MRELHQAHAYRIENSEEEHVRYVCKYCPSGAKTFTDFDALIKHIKASTSKRHGEQHETAKAEDGWFKADFYGLPSENLLRERRRVTVNYLCLLYTSPSPRDRTRSRMPSSA